MQDTGAVEDYGECGDRAVEIVLEPEVVVIQYRPALDPTGRHWDDAIRRLDGIHPFLDEAGWEALDEPSVVLGEDTEDETHFYVAPTAVAHQDGLIGRLRSLTLQEQAALYLAVSTKRTSSYGATLTILTIAPKSLVKGGLPSPYRRIIRDPEVP